MAASFSHCRSVQRLKRVSFSSPCGLSRCAHIIAVRVSERMAETPMAMASVTANSRKSRPMMPPMKSSGMSTATSETVRETMVKPIWLAPLSAASNGGGGPPPQGGGGACRTRAGGRPPRVGGVFSPTTAGAAPPGGGGGVAPPRGGGLGGKEQKKKKKKK